MKITEKQLMVMFDVLKHSCKVYGGVDGYSHDYLCKMTDQIMNQQSDELIDVKGEKDAKKTKKQG